MGDAVSRRCAAWPHRWLLFHETVDHMHFRGLPAIADFQDLTWAPPDKDRLLAYLEAAPDIVGSSLKKLSCPFCGAHLAGDIWCHSDGVWVWPHDLAHYVREHAVRLPDSFVTHIRRRRYEASGRDARSWDTLDWPQ